MPSSSVARRTDWDIFCTVIDNYGDIGVCWRLARQLVAEHPCTVRLWVDALAAFRTICPQIDTQRSVQQLQGVEVRWWTGDFPVVRPGDVVVEAFACQLPESFIAAMAEREPRPAWINLDYLSAEAWVSGCHALPSPHPRLPLTKYFFFPGFVGTTGGLLRESRLEADRRAFIASSDEQAAFWARLGQLPPPPEALRVSLFAYENPALADLLTLWAQGAQRVCCLAPVTRTLPALEEFAGRALAAGDVVRHGSLEIRLLSFVTQDDYDRLLWSCDVNFVRGEDSFVRALWAAKPMLWQIYPQDDDAHLIKLAAFLDLYCADLPLLAASATRKMHAAWNSGARDGAMSAELWARWLELLPELRRYAEHWQIIQSKQQDLCTSLFRFGLSKL